MYVLNVEDNAFKHGDIVAVLNSIGITEIDWEMNLVDGVERICDQFDFNKPYDLIITDMWYPEYRGGKDASSGEKLIQKAVEKKWNIPIIMCSSVNYSYPGVLGSVHYSEKEDQWKTKLKELIEKLEK